MPLVVDGQKGIRLIPCEIGELLSMPNTERTGKWPARLPKEIFCCKRAHGRHLSHPSRFTIHRHWPECIPFHQHAT